MEAAATLGAHAAALNELLREREQLLLDRQRLAMQAEELRGEVEQLRGEVAQLRGAAGWALRDLRMGKIETAEERLAAVVDF